MFVVDRNCNIVDSLVIVRLCVLFTVSSGSFDKFCIVAVSEGSGTCCNVVGTFWGSGNMLNSYFCTLTENIFHPELCEGSHQNERSHFVRSIFLSTQSFLCIEERTTIVQVPRFDLGLDFLLPRN